MTAPEFLTTRNATLPDMVAMLRHQRARRLDVVAPAAAIHAHEGNLVISGGHCRKASIDSSGELSLVDGATVDQVAED